MDGQNQCDPRRQGTVDRMVDKVVRAEGYASGAGIIDGAAAGLGGQGAAVGDCIAARQSARGVLSDRVQRLRREADQLEALSRALPEELPRGADEALWELLIRR